MHQTIVTYVTEVLYLTAYRGKAKGVVLKWTDFSVQNTRLRSGNGSLRSAPDAVSVSLKTDDSLSPTLGSWPAQI